MILQIDRYDEWWTKLAVMNMDHFQIKKEDYGEMQKGHVISTSHFLQLKYFP